MLLWDGHSLVLCVGGGDRERGGTDRGEFDVQHLACLDSVFVWPRAWRLSE